MTTDHGNEGHVRTGLQVKVARGLKGERYRAELVGADPDKDVAVIRIDTQGKVLTTLGHSSMLRDRAHCSRQLEH